MKRTTKNLMTLCCSALLAATGCTSAGELSISGMYGSQGQALSGDRCDELLMDAADAETAEEQEDAQREYRECVEEALEEDGRDGECRDDDDDTCDIILEEVGDALDRVRGEGNEAPECDAPSSNSEEALCHLMAAYEACELDHDNDGEPDVEDRPDEDGEEGDRPKEEGEGGEDGDRPNESAECEEIRDLAGNVGEEDALHLKEENPECFGEGGEAGEEPKDEPADEPKDEPHEGEEPPAEGESSTDPFCEELERDIDACATEAECAELLEIHERECKP